MRSGWCTSSTPSPTCTARAQQRIRALIWWFYADLKAYCATPTTRRRSELRARFDRIFLRRTGFATLDRLLQRLHANKPELLMVLDRPEIPLHTNGSERDIRCHVTKRKISGGTHSEAGRDCRDAFLGLMQTCAKLGIAFWDYLGARLQSRRPLPFHTSPTSSAAAASQLNRPARLFAPITALITPRNRSNRIATSCATNHAGGLREGISVWLSKMQRIRVTEDAPSARSRPSATGSFTIMAAASPHLAHQQSGLPPAGHIAADW